MKSKPVPPPPVAATFNDYRPKPKVADEEDFMASLLGNLDNVAPDTYTRSRKRKPREASPPPVSSDDDRFTSYRRNGDPYADTSSDGPLDDLSEPHSDTFDVSSPFKKPRVESVGVTPAVQKLHKFKMDVGSDDFAPYNDSFDDINMDDFAADDEELKAELGAKALKMEVEDVKLSEIGATAKLDNRSIPAKKEEAPSWLNVHAALTVTSDDTLGTSSPSTVKTSNISALEDDDSLRFFWLDYLEQDGKVFFIGKLKDKASGSWVSCCVTVENLERNLFVLPREKRVG